MSTVVRLVVGALGVAAAAFGAVSLLDLGLDNLRAAGIWLVGGVLLHDAVLAPVTVAVGVAVLRLLRGRLPAPVVTGAVVLGTVTLVAVPVLGRFGARSDNPTLLDRNYVLGWLAVATLTSVAVALATAVPALREAAARRAKEEGGHGTSAGRR